MNRRAMEWIVGMDTGVSSQAIWARMQGVRGEWWPGNHPHDPDDLGRCLRLLALIPEWRARLSEMAAESPSWAALVEYWDELENVWRTEGDGTWRPPMGTAMPKLYDRMREILDAVPSPRNASVPPSSGERQP